MPASDALRLSQGSKEGLRLKQDVPTRFYSTLFMFERFVALSDHIASVLIKFPGGPAMLTAAELTIIQEVLGLLKHFKDAIVEISAEKNVTLTREGTLM